MFSISDSTSNLVCFNAVENLFDASKIENKNKFRQCPLATYDKSLPYIKRSTYIKCWKEK